MHVSINDIVYCLESSNDLIYYYFDKKNYKFVMYNGLDEEYNEVDEDIMLSEDYIRLPEVDEFKMMRNFAFMQKEVNQNILLDILYRPKAFRNFKDMVHKLGLTKRWYRYRDERLKEIAINWCKENNISCEEK